MVVDVSVALSTLRAERLWRLGAGLLLGVPQGILPLSPYYCVRGMWHPWEESNLQQAVLETTALPELTDVVRTVGVEPTHPCRKRFYRPHGSPRPAYACRIRFSGKKKGLVCIP